MTLLNTPMPVDKIYKIVESIFYSNMNTKISVSYRYWPTTLEEILTPISYGQFCDNDIRSLITINSITPIAPKYSVWDKVLILSTGEIGEVTNDITKFERWMYVVWESCFHRSEIAKLPNDL